MTVNQGHHLRIGNRIIGDSQPCFIIGEIGINHNGSLDIALKLIDTAVEAGVDAVKFQKRTVEVVYTPEELNRPRESPFGDTNRDLKYGLELDWEEYSEIDRYCKQKGILWFASCWDETSVDFIDKFNPPCYKIASASLTDVELLRHTCAKGKPIILSTGMSTLEEIEGAINIVRKLIGNNFMLMHCVSTYPAEIDELNLRAIGSLKERFAVAVGYSGHERGVATSVLAVALGACAVERHITLDRAMWGSDQAASLEPKGLQLLVRDIRVWEIAQGDGQKRVCQNELPLIKKLRRKHTLPIRQER